MQCTRLIHIQFGICCHSRLDGPTMACKSDMSSDRCMSSAGNHNCYMPHTQSQGDTRLARTGARNACHDAEHQVRNPRLRKASTVWDLCIANLNRQSILGTPHHTNGICHQRRGICQRGSWTYTTHCRAQERPLADTLYACRPLSRSSCTVCSVVHCRFDTAVSKHGIHAPHQRRSHLGI